MRLPARPAVTLAAVLLLAGCRTASPLEHGLSLYKQGDWAAAVAAFDDVVRLDPRSETAYTNRGAARLHLGDTPGAVADFTRALELKPRQPETLFFNRGNAHALAGNTAAALADFTRAVEIRPDFSRAFFNRGLVRARTRDLQGARADWQHAIAIEPDLRIRAAMARQAEEASLPSPAAEPAPPATPAAAPEPPPASPIPPPLAAPVPSPVTSPASPEPATPSMVTGSPVVTPAEASPIPAPSAPPPGSREPPIDARALANRGIHRELAGDHEGALSDLRAALQLEKDPARRAGIENLLKLLEPTR